MTESEYARALESLTPEQLKAFCLSVGGDVMTIEERLQEFAYYNDREALERVIAFRLKQVAGIEIKTESDKLSDDSATSAKAATRSADASERSAAAAARSAHVAWYAVIAAVLAIIVTIALARGL